MPRPAKGESCPADVITSAIKDMCIATRDEFEALRIDEGDRTLRSGGYDTFLHLSVCTVPPADQIRAPRFVTQITVCPAFCCIVIQFGVMPPPPLPPGGRRGE
jgi:hypothetical protein